MILRPAADWGGCEPSNQAQQPHTGPDRGWRWGEGTDQSGGWDIGKRQTLQLRGMYRHHKVFLLTSQQYKCISLLYRCLLMYYYST